MVPKWSSTAGSGEHGTRILARKLRTRDCRPFPSTEADTDRDASSTRKNNMRNGRQQTNEREKNRERDKLTRRLKPETLAREVPHHHVGGHLHAVLRQRHPHHGQRQVAQPPGLARPLPPRRRLLLLPRQQQRQRGGFALPRTGGRHRSAARPPSPRARRAVAYLSALRRPGVLRPQVSSACVFRCMCGVCRLSRTTTVEMETYWIASAESSSDF
jgi:hypothetical protein